MAIHVALNHLTHYTYDRLVTHSPHVIRLRPAPHCRTRILAYSLNIQPAEHFIHWQQDPHGNHLARVVFPEPATELRVEVDLVAEMAVHNPFDFFLEEEAEQYPFTYETALRLELEPFLETAATGPLFEDWFASVRGTRARTVDFLVGLNQRLQKAIQYVIRLEPGVQAPEETLAKGRGSCRDSAWLLVQLARRLGLAARFASGYLVQLAPDVQALDGPSGSACDFTDLHAWAEIYLPGAGWIGFDPTSGLLAGEGHIPLACTPNPRDAAPVAGAVDPCEARLDHQMRVARIHESPRVTKPYSEAQWGAIEAAGRQVDACLEREAVGLTMGGEPTFVSIDDPDGPEWNTAALGARKRELAGQLLKRLRARFAPQGLLFYGQGKWYPGESLPRWALACHWRGDGQPVWREDRWIADESIDYGHGIAEAENLMRELAAALGVEPGFILPAYEDAWHYLRQERHLPVNVDPLDSKLENPQERARLARVFEQGLSQVAGFVLPLRRGGKPGEGDWQTGPWFFRSGRLYLLPGDSPIGYRLPLESLPWVAPEEYPWIQAPDPFRPQPPLPVPARLIAQSRPAANRAGEAAPTAAPAVPARGESAAWVTRTALCVEPRHGRLHLFLPPLTSLENFLDLVAVIEATVQRLQIPVILEGEPPPADARLTTLKITPDPGVIEVNLHPARNWEELAANTVALYEEARLCRLAAEKFMLDGRHAGTGGGNHIVFGGATPAESPILRRPDLLRSLVGYWQNHPSLSYLFSGMFIGPTSQHPRVDEARHDALYELELAFQQIPESGAVPPWLVDRVFRHLLVDATGNTHRAEFCIDKLYAPESASGRLGLVELRSFEMPPHAQMSLAQHLLLRALIAWFWRQPWRQPLVPWGTGLHDRFLLPHFAWEDFQDVLADLRRAGFDLAPEWFAPHLEFRFPRCGTIAQRGIVLELRQALEPWHVLGEEPGAGGTVRLVDSSVERLQVKVSGWVDPRYLMACNRRRLPLHPTGVNGEFVAGVRYRAWQPASCLHPTLGIDSPLVFDILDSWSGRSLGGCTYHVMHPGGRNYEAFPVNACEAESRRLARFFPSGHSPGEVAMPAVEPNASFPFTLDLRRAAGAKKPA
jgi:uncharacterized protein (DUF2126 family)/transglutaminase-like putative cysteine protease